MGQGPQPSSSSCLVVSWGFPVTSLQPIAMLAVSLLNGRGAALGEAATSPTAPVAHAHALQLLPAWAWAGSQGCSSGPEVSSQEPAALAAVRVELSRNF